MSRAARLLDLLQLLRRHRRPVAGAAIAQALGISLRTLYRDVATLQAQGAGIEGSPGLGYVLREGFVLPPLMFTAEETEALVLGSRWVARRGDRHLAAAAHDALAKIAAVLPPALRASLDQSALIVGPAPGDDPAPPDDAVLAAIRRAIGAEHRLSIRYRDATGQSSQRWVWPFALGFFEQVRVLVAWCELRQAVRHFRTDRIDGFAASDERYPQRRHALLKAWRAEQGIESL